MRACIAEPGSVVDDSNSQPPALNRNGGTTSFATMMRIFGFAKLRYLSKPASSDGSLSWSSAPANGSLITASEKLRAKIQTARGKEDGNEQACAAEYREHLQCF